MSFEHYLHRDMSRNRKCCMERPAETTREWYAMLADETQDIIRTNDDWVRYIGSAADNQDHPLYLCSDGAIASLSQNILFAETGGLSSIGYESAGHNLTYFEFQRFVSAFGIGPKLFASFEKMRCEWDSATKLMQCYSRTLYACDTVQCLKTKRPKGSSDPGGHGGPAGP